MTNEQTPEGEPMTGVEPPAAPVPGSDTPTTVTPPPLPPLAPYATQASAPQAPAAAPATSMVPPPIPPPVNPQPAIAWQAAPPPAVAVKGRRTVLAAVAGLLLLLGGIGGIVLGLLIALVGGTIVSNFGQFGNMPELNGADPNAVFAGVIAFVGLIIVAYSVAYLLAGIGVLRNSNWARVLGIVVGFISGLIWLSGTTSSNQISDPASAASTSLFSIVALAIHVYIVVALLFFWRTKPSAA